MRYPVYRHPCVQNIFELFRRTYGVEGAVAKLAGGVSASADGQWLRGVHSTDDLALDGVESGTILELADAGLLDDEPADGWERIAVVRCGGCAECPRCADNDRRRGAVCHKIRNVATGEIALCEGWRYKFLPQAPEGWLGASDDGLEPPLKPPSEGVANAIDKLRAIYTAESKKLWTNAGLATKVGVSGKTIYRAIKQMRLAGEKHPILRRARPR